MSARGGHATKQPDSLTREQRFQIAQREYLAKLVIYEFATTCVKLVDLAAAIRELWKEFENLPQGETILGCRTKTEFCEKHLHRKLRTIQYMLAGGNPHNKTRREIISSVPPEPDIPMLEPTAEEQAEWRAENRAWRAKRAEQRAAEAARQPSEEAPPPRRSSRSFDYLLRHPVSAAVRAAAQAIVNRGYKAEATTKHPDHGGTHESMLAVNEAFNWLRALIEEAA
jgi:hypothetical protein